MKMKMPQGAVPMLVKKINMYVELFFTWKTVIPSFKSVAKKKSYYFSIYVFLLNFSLYISVYL